VGGLDFVRKEDSPSQRHREKREIKKIKKIKKKRDKNNSFSKL